MNYNKEKRPIDVITGKCVDIPTEYKQTLKYINHHKYTP